MFKFKCFSVYLGRGHLYQIPTSCPSISGIGMDLFILCRIQWLMGEYPDLSSERVFKKVNESQLSKTEISDFGGLGLKV